MSNSEYPSKTDDGSPEVPAEETELWEAIQEAKDDKFVRPDQDFEF